MAGVVAETRAADAAASRDLAGSMGFFLREAALPAVQAFNGAGASTLLPATLAPEETGCKSCPEAVAVKQRIKRLGM